MYKVNEKVIKTDSGKSVTLYGITSKNHKFEALSSSKEKVELLCSLCIRLELKEEHLGDVVEDFVNSLS